MTGKGRTVSAELEGEGSVHDHVPSPIGWRGARSLTSSLVISGYGFFAFCSTTTKPHKMVAFDYYFINIEVDFWQCKCELTRRTDGEAKTWSERS